MPVLLLLTLYWSVALTSASLCDITETISTSEDDGTYFSLERDNTCYVFSLKEVEVREAQRFCRSIGGSLTDVESETDNSLQKVLAEEKKNNSDLDTRFWIGLMWNDHIRYWYWDSGVTQVFQLNYRRAGFTWMSKACVYMTVEALITRSCREDHAFICKIDLDCYVNKNTNSSSCTPRCADYIKTHKLEAVVTRPTKAAAPRCDNTATGADGVANTTEDGDKSRTGAHDKCLAEGQPAAADYQLVLILMASFAALAAILLVTSIVMCAKLVKYRRMLRDNDSPTRISMVDILKANSPSTARGKRPDNHNSSHPGSTSKLLNNAYNTYATPDSDVGQAGVSPDFIYQENGYSSAAEPSRSDEEAIPGPQPGPDGNVYMNCDMEDLDQEGPRYVCVLGNASKSPTDSWKTSDPCEIYANQQFCGEYRSSAVNTAVLQ